MGKKRVDNPLNLPPRVYEKHGAFFYVDKEHKWHRLGERWDREAKEQWAKWSSGAAADGSVADLLDRFLAHNAGRVAAGTLRSRTHEDNKVEADNLKKFFGHMPASAVKKRHVALYLSNRTDKHGKHAPIRANREVSFLSAAYSWAIGKVELDDNPCLGVPRNKENVRERYVENRERRAFAKRCCPDWLRAYLLLKYLTGLRMGDMLRLSSANETERGLRVTIGKSRRRKVLEFRWTWALRTTVGFIHSLTDAERKRHRQTGALQPNEPTYLHKSYFGVGRNQPLSTSGFKSAWQRAMRKWEVEGGSRFWEHDIRAASGSDAPTVGDAQERLGHDDQRTTSRHYRRGVQRVRPLR